MAAGRVVPISYSDTLADGLAGNIEAGSVTVPLLSNVAFTCVDEAQIRAAMRWLMVNHGVVAEGAGAAPLAALIKERLNVEAVLTPGKTGQFDVIADGKRIAERGGNLLTRRFGAGYPDFDGVVERLAQHRTSGAAR